MRTLLLILESILRVLRILKPTEDEERKKKIKELEREKKRLISAMVNARSHNHTDQFNHFRLQLKEVERELARLGR